MPRLKRQGSAPGEGWTPLPVSTQSFQIDAILETQSSKGNDQLKVSVHVTDGAQADKKATIFYSLKDNALWKLIGLLDAIGIDYDYTEIDGKDENGRPLCEIDFDTDDMPGCTFQCDVTQRDYNGQKQNDFVRERPIPGSPAALRAAEAAREKEGNGKTETPAGKAAEKPAAAAATASAAGPGRRTART